MKRLKTGTRSPNIATYNLNCLCELCRMHREAALHEFRSFGKPRVKSQGEGEEEKLAWKTSILLLKNSKLISTKNK